MHHGTPPSSPAGSLRFPTIPELPSRRSSSTTTFLGYASYQQGHGSLAHDQEHPHTSNNEYRNVDDAYPPDELGEELSSHARVWRVYMNESTRVDNDMVNGWHHSLDVLLVFAGLFSAVVTTFVVQSSLSLQPDYTVISASLLTELVALQRATAQGLSLENVPSSQTVNSAFAPSVRNRWINGLWYISLVFSLVSALVSMIVKQWLQAYVTGILGTPQERARLRHFRYMGLQGWHVPGIVGALPVLMHTSLFLFFMGLIQLLGSLDNVISLIMSCVVALAYFLYIASTLLPLLYPHCPYKTPLSEYMLKFSSQFFRFFSDVFEAMQFTISDVADERAQGTFLPNMQRNHRHRLPGNTQAPSNSWREAELVHIHRSTDALDARAISWLFTSSADEAVIDITLQALSGLHADFQGIEILRQHGALVLVEEAFQSSFPNIEKSQSLAIEIERVERYGRALLHLVSSLGPMARMQDAESLRMFQRLAKVQDDPNVAVLGSCATIRFIEYGYKTTLRGIRLLERFLEEDMAICEYTLTLLLDSVSESVIVWGVPSGSSFHSVMPIFIKLVDKLQPSLQSRLGKAIATAFHLCVQSYGNGEQRFSANSMEAYRRQPAYNLMVEALVTVLENCKIHEDVEAVLPQATMQLSKLTLDAVIKDWHGFNTSYHTEPATSSLAGLFISGRLDRYSIPEPTMAHVLQLFLRSLDKMPTNDPQFVNTLIQVLSSVEEEVTRLRSLLLIRHCVTQCSLDICRAFRAADGLLVMREQCTNVVTLASVAGRAVCAFVESVATNYRNNEDVEEELDYLYRSNAVKTICHRAGFQRWSLFEVHKYWLPPLLQLCRIRPKDSVWREAIQIFIESVRDVIGKEEQMLMEPDVRFADLGRSVVTALEEMKSLASIDPSEEAFHILTPRSSVSLDVSGKGPPPISGIDAHSSK